MEMFGVTVEGTPGPGACSARRLAGRVVPAAQRFHRPLRGPARRKDTRRMATTQPQRPRRNSSSRSGRSTRRSRNPAHFEFTVDGETVTSARVRFGYVHRGIEKGAEKRNWVPGAVPAGAHLRHLLARPLDRPTPSASKNWPGSTVAPARPGHPRARGSSWSASTATCCGSAWRRTRPGSTPSSCIPGATARR